MDVLVQHEDEEADEERHARHGDNADHAHGKIALRHALDDLDEKAAAIKRRDRQQVHKPQGNRDERHEEQPVYKPSCEEVARHHRNADDARRVRNGLCRGLRIEQSDDRLECHDDDVESCLKRLQDGRIEMRDLARLVVNDIDPDDGIDDDEGDDREEQVHEDTCEHDDRALPEGQRAILLLALTYEMVMRVGNV